jgi:hypothetical protein
LTLRLLQDSAVIDARTRVILRRNLDQGTAAGESMGELIDRVHGVMGGRRTDAANVARNSVGQALSHARHEGHIAGGMTHKGWMHSRGPGVRRPAHVEAEARYRAEPKPVGVPFIVHGVPLRFPRDPAGPPGEIIHCQCIVIGKRLPAQRAGGRPAIALGDGGHLLADALRVGFADLETTKRFTAEVAEGAEVKEITDKELDPG